MFSSKKQRELIWISQDFPKLSCKEYQLLYTGLSCLPRCLKFLSGDHFLKDAHHSSVLEDSWWLLLLCHFLPSLLLNLVLGIFYSLMVHSLYFLIAYLYLSVFLTALYNEVLRIISFQFLTSSGSSLVYYYLLSSGGRYPGGGHGNPLQYSRLENHIDRGAWRAPVHEVAKSWTWLSDQHFNFFT